MRYPVSIVRRVTKLGYGMAFGGVLSKYRKGNIASFHIGRCGSTVLGGMLNQHSHIFWDGEILTRYYWYKRRGYASLLPCDMKDLQKNIILSRMRIAGKNYYGFETRFSQVDLFSLTLPEYIDQLEALGYSHFIILERRNYLKAAISWHIANEKMKYHQPYSQKAKLDPITFDIHNLRIDKTCKPLISYLHEWDNYYKKIETLLRGKNALKIIYEVDILNDPRKGYERICAFLNLPPEKAAVQHSRTNPYKVNEILLNYQEVAEALAGTLFEWMLYE